MLAAIHTHTHAHEQEHMTPTHGHARHRGTPTHAYNHGHEIYRHAHGHPAVLIIKKRGGRKTDIHLSKHGRHCSYETASSDHTYAPNEQRRSSTLPAYPDDWKGRRWGGGGACDVTRVAVGGVCTLQVTGNLDNGRKLWLKYGIWGTCEMLAEFTGAATACVVKSFP